MLPNIIQIIISVFFLFAISLAQGQEKIPPLKEIYFSNNDRILILAPHPDDEVLGCAGVIQRALELNLPIKVVFLTYGDSNEWAFLLYRKHPVILPKSAQEMGLVRYNEAQEANKVLGLLPEQLIFLGYPDFGTLNIWYKHWDESPPFKSILTKVRSVPYKNAFRPGALYKGEEILKDLTEILGEFRPTKIFLSHPADHNVDHRALYLFTNVALWDLGMEHVELYPYLIHYKSWPKPKGYHPQEKLLPPDLYKKEIDWRILSLNPNEVIRKKNALKKHRSQFKSSRAFLESFIRKNELFGDFDRIKLSAKPITIFPEKLIGKESALSMGSEKYSISIVNDNLIFSLSLFREPAKEDSLSVYLFGYRRGVPFGKMPKIHVRLRALLYKVYDQKKPIALCNSGIKIIKKGRQITISIPLQVLGSPERIFTSTNIYLWNIPSVWMPWRILEIMPKQEAKQ